MKVYMAWYDWDCECFGPFGIYATKEEAINVCKNCTGFVYVYEIELGQNLYCEDWKEWVVWEK